MIWRALLIAARTDDVFGRVAAAGIACWFGFQAFQNIGMCLGIMPVTGVPLPFVSYGGSSMFAGMLAVGLLQNIHLRAKSAPAARLTPVDDGSWCAPDTGTWQDVARALDPGAAATRGHSCARHWRRSRS